MPRSKIEREEYSRTLDGTGLVISSTSGALNVSADITGGTVTETNSGAILADTTSIRGKLPTALGTQSVANSLAVNIASDQIVPVSGTVTAELSSVDNAVLDSINSALGGTLTVSGQLLSGVCGTHGNATPLVTLPGSGTYDYTLGVDAQYCSKISAFGSITPDTEITVKLQHSQDDSNWYDCGVSYTSSGLSLQHFSMSLNDAGARYFRLGFAETNVSPTASNCVGTIAGKQ